LVADEGEAFGSRRRALAFQAEGRGFEPRLPLLKRGKSKGFPLF